MNKLRYYMTHKYIGPALMILPPVIFFILFLLIMGQKPHVFFPDQEKLLCGTYSDNIKQGNSQINYFQVDTGGMHFSYTVKKGCDFPYAGVNFIIQGQSPFIDASKYSHLTIHLESDLETNLTFHINTFLDNFTKPNSHLSYTFYQYTFFATPVAKVYKINLKDFRIQDWWFEENNVEADLVKNENFSKVSKISLSNGHAAALDVQQRLLIKKIQFEKDKQKPLMLLSSLVILYVILLTTGIVILKRKQVKPGPVYTALDITGKVEDRSGDPESLEKIVSYIGNHYHNMDLTLEMVSKELNIAAYKISGLLKDTFQLSYPAYINEIRLTEAKRLLIETDIKIIDIAMTIGYKSVSHFHRIFKKHNQLSPKQFRQDNRP